ncbi:DUF6902 family protein [Gemmobacter sp.]|uniref:DUF6902 family protein n=1 Tax=Gemmobacter sp. TaxID=1898957 RepID=UPI002B000D35|nr:hypothetical protein [Gemmobacter sp.]
MSNILTLPDMRRRRAPAAAPGRLVELFALHRHGPGDVRWLKENAEILRLLVATGQAVEPEALHRIHAATARDLATRLTFFPQYYRFFLSIAQDLQALGLTGLDAGALVARAYADGLPEAEMSDLQRAEARLFGQRIGMASGDDGLTDRLLRFAGRSATFALPNKKAAYELTHIAFYLSDYGRHAFENAAGLTESLEYAGLIAWLEQNTDLLAEICLALRFCGATPPAVWDQGVAADLAQVHIGPADGAAAGDDYHCWLMAAWSASAAGGRPLDRLLPGGALAFAAPRRTSALHELSAALMDLDAARSADWSVMRRRLAGRLSAPALDIVDSAAASTPAFQPFFARFARVDRKGFAA